MPLENIGKPGVDVFSKTDVSRYSVKKMFAKFTGKHLHQSPFFNKVAGHRLFFIEHLWWLPLYYTKMTDSMATPYLNIFVMQMAALNS